VLNHTTVANVLFMQAASPIAAALIAWLALREPISRMTGVAMAVALLGVGVMVGGPGGARGVGLALSVLMMLSFAVTVVITRHRRDISMAPAICLSQVLVLVVFAPFSQPGKIDATDLLLLALLGVTQIGLGLAFLTMAARLLPAAEVALITLLEVVLGPLWVWLALSERPSTATLVGGVIVVAAVVLQAASGARYQPRFSSSSDGSSDEVEMPTIASPSPADTRASTSASM
jgi:drug/metabolite transporter (DMT)-like permease